MEEKNNSFFKYLSLIFIIIFISLGILYIKDNEHIDAPKTNHNISADSLYNMTAKQKLKDSEIFLKFNLLCNKNDFTRRESKLIVKNIISEKYFPMIDKYALGYNFKFKDVTFFGCIYPHFYNNKLYNLEIEVFNEDDNEINVHESISNLYKIKYKSWKYASKPGSDYWFKDGKMIIIHDNVINYIVPKYEILYKKAINAKKNRDANKTKDDI